MKRDWNLAPALQIIKKISVAYIYQLTKFGGLMSCGSEDIFKMDPVSFTNAHHDVTDLVNHGIVKHVRTGTSWEQNVTFLWNKKFLTCTSDGTFSEVIIL